MANINLIVIGQESTLTQAEVSSFITPGFASKYKIKYIKTPEKEITPTGVSKLISAYQTGFEEEATIIVNLCNISRIQKIDKEGDLKHARYIGYSETKGEDKLKEKFPNIRYLGMLDPVSGGSNLLEKIETCFQNPENMIKGQEKTKININNDFSFDETTTLNDPIYYFFPEESNKKTNNSNVKNKKEKDVPKKTEDSLLNPVDMAFFSMDIEDSSNNIEDIKTEEIIENNNPLAEFNAMCVQTDNNFPWEKENIEPVKPKNKIKPKEKPIKGIEERKKQVLERKLSNEENIEMSVDYDTGKRKRPAKLITVYSAKGGVGKTTIATELATYLSLTAHGRDTFKVLVIDYDIEFGDVLGTMDLNPKKPTLTNFVADIRQRKQQNIPLKYTEEDIKRFIQTDPRSGLDALVAPINNLESMSITNKELAFILECVVKNGGYDFVICDTGNNTQDSSFIALEQANEIIIVLTQSVNTANCNDGMLISLYELYKDSNDFDFNKFKIVVNKIKSGKALGIEPEELVEAILNPENGERFKCIGMINDEDAVKKSNNEGIPMVFTPSSNFTKSISQIATSLIGESPQIKKDEKKRKNIFGKFIKKG